MLAPELMPVIVSPSGESMLVDTGWAGFNRRDANRILAAAKSAGVKKIDYLVTTHYHSDHVGGVPQLADAPWPDTASPIPETYP